MRQRHLHGFTLLELMVAIAVFSVLAAIAYGGLRSVLNSEQNVEALSYRLSAIQQAMVFIGRDVAQVSARGIRDEYGDRQPPLRSLTGIKPVLEFTRGGWSNPAGQMRSTLQRVGYGLEDRQLVRYSWRVLDRAPDSKPDRLILLDKVTSMKVRFMDQRGVWNEQWPLPGTGQAQEGLPRAVEVTLELKDAGVLRRLFMIDAVSVAPGTLPLPG